MSPRSLAFAVALALTTATAFAAEEPAKVPSMQEILDASPKTDWRTLDPDRTLYLQLPAGRVVIELAPAFAPEHVANIRTLALEPGNIFRILLQGSGQQRTPGSQSQQIRKQGNVAEQGLIRARLFV